MPRSETRVEVVRGATFADKDRTLRTELARTWDTALPVGGFVGLNPGKADEHNDDATARKYVGFARRWGWGGYRAWNLFELVSTDPKGLWSAVTRGDQVTAGLPPDGALRAGLDAGVGVVCVAWGNPPTRHVHRLEWAARAACVLRVLRYRGARVVCAARTASGHPAHLSRLPYQGLVEYR